ncbi:related to helicase-dna-binding protein [Sporisorium reilianum SRZ2]|uniref:Related to helicase-dna-binding protein n=1 Tax=Sporisorium reilianum (strain SRZ2) TaxID=999809 RepID=E6ZLF0_SPORE|nr:related to helicase-dna-binding protein [Sporisorium reilianum SRZ2]
MPSVSRATRANKEVDDIDLSFLDEDEDILAVNRRSSRSAKGKAPAPAVTQSSSRSSQRSATGSTSAAAPSSSRRGGRSQASAAPRRRSRRDSFVEDDEEDDQRDDDDDAESSSDDVDIDDIIASMNGAGSSRASSSRSKQSPSKKKPTKKTTAASSTRSSARTTARSSRSSATSASASSRRRAPPRQRFPPLIQDSDAGTDDQDDLDIDQDSDDLRQELDDLNDDTDDQDDSDAGAPLRRSTRRAQSKGATLGSRKSGRGGARSSTRAAKTRRTLLSDDDDDDATSDSNEAFENQEEPEEDDDEDEEEDELESSDADYGRRGKRKKPLKSKQASKKRQRLARGAPKPRAKPRRKAPVKRLRFAPVREPKMRFALQGELPEPVLGSPSFTEVPIVTIDQTALPDDLDNIPFLDGIEPTYSPSEHSSEEEEEQADSDDDEVQVVSEAGSGEESEEADPYKEPEASVDKHWPGCKRCTDGPALPLYNKALSQLKRVQRREANKLRNKSPERIDSRGRQRKTLIDDAWGKVTAVQAAEEWLEVLEDRGGWFECKTCSVSWHWGCLPQDTQKAILVGINREAARRHQTVFGKNASAPSPVRWIDVDDVVDTDSCPDCAGYASFCTVCKANVQGVRSVGEELGFTKDMLEQYPEPPAELAASKLFRCKRCSRATHYECLAEQQTDGDQSLEQVAKSIQEAGWFCKDCHRCPAVDKIIAWRQLDRRLWNDEEAKRAEYATLSPRENLPREYLVKFKDRSFRDTEWVPHDWLRIVHQLLLSHFLAKGSRLELEPAELIESASALNTARRNRASLALGGGRALPSTPIQTRTRSVKKTLKVDETGEVDVGPPGPMPDAQRRIPKPWMTPDRILAVKYFSSIDRDDDDMEEIGGATVDSDTVALDKLEPSDYLRSWAHVAKVLIKWQDQPYEGSTWEDPPTRRKQSDIFYETQEAYRSFLLAQKVTFPALTAEEKRSKRERRLAKSGTRFRALDDQPHCIEGGDLIDFQLEGVNWLRYGWYNQKPGILADEMGLGKTVQIITFLASIWKESRAGPFLVVVPNSTLPNWMREFEKWMPQFRVVPYWGEGEARDMISKYELFHSKKTLEKKDASVRPIKFHVVVASDTSVRIDSLPLRKVEHWDVVIVDEGQNLKSGKSILMKRLNEMQADHRIIMTGTPLNNNVTELFNLLNWLEPGGQWKDVKALESEYSVLKPEVIEDLQKRLKPYFLRRLKKEVLDLPPKIELIVPTSLRPIQKRIYRSILESNIEDIQALAASREKGAKKGQKSTITNLNNTLMQLRKCIQHPYLIAPDLETREGEANYEATWEHQRLIDASAKLSLLQRLLPKLKAEGHRVLLFSQFVINLDIVEVFLRGEGYKFLRLDGAIGQKQRQKGIDAFNAPDSPYFIYMISTRAGGVGINLATADTVIIMDPDFNPHVDMQAIARAHRIGQTKKLLVFTLMCKATAEERMIESAKRKMMLDHLIVQNLDKEDERPVELESILKFGAQALFAEGGTEESERDIRYTDEDLDSLLQRREDAIEDDDKALDDDNQDANGDPKTGFSYARVWEADQPAATDAVGIAPTTVVDDDFWADLLQKHREDAAKRAEELREKEAQEKRASRRDRIKAMLQDDEVAEVSPVPVKRGPGRPKKVVKPVVDEDFTVPEGESDSDDHELINAVQEEDEALPAVQALRQRQIKSSNAAIAAAAAAAAAAALAASKAVLAVPGSATAMPSDPTALYAAPTAAAASGSSAAPAPAVVKKQKTRAAVPRTSAAPSSSAASKKSKPTPPGLASLQRDLIAEHRLPRPAPLGDLDLSLPIIVVRPGHLAAMRRVLLSLLPDSEFALEVAMRALKDEVPDLAPRHMRFQMTDTHINYYMQTFNVPRALFEAAFSIIAEDSIPPEILALPHGGAIALDWRKIKELLLRTATYMVLALRRPKHQPPWTAAIEEWNTSRAGKPPPTVINIADSPPASAGSLPAPAPATAGAAVDVLRDRARCDAWVAAVAARGDTELTKVAQLVSSNPSSTPAPNLVLMVQSYMDGRGIKPAYGPSKLSIRAGMRAEAFVDPEVMGPPATISAGNAAAASPTPSASTPSGSQPRPNRVAAALSRLSAFSGGSPRGIDVSKKAFSKLNVDVAVNYRKPRIKSSRSSIGGSPRSSMGPSPSPALHGFAGDSFPPMGALDGDDDGMEDDGSTFVISDQTCIICGGAFHYLNRCPEMSDVTRASARWFQLCDQLRILTARGMTDGDSDVATIKTTIKVMARKLNGLQAQTGQGPLVPPFA